MAGRFLEEDASLDDVRNRLLAALADRQFTQDPTAPEVVRERLSAKLGLS